jgi:hypothetical protein
LSASSYVNGRNETGFAFGELIVQIV